MPEQWLTYRQLGELWNTTPEAARARSRRGNYQRRTSEQGTAEVLVDVEAILAAMAQRPQPAVQAPSDWMSMPPPYVPGAGEVDAMSLKSLQELEAQVSTLSQELGKAEEQLDTLRKHLAAEREQVAHLMTVLLRGEKRKLRPKGPLGWLLFWRKRAPATSRLITSAATPNPSPAPVSKPDAALTGLRTSPDSTPVITPRSPVIVPDSPPVTTPRSPVIVPDSPETPTAQAAFTPDNIPEQRLNDPDAP